MHIKLSDKNLTEQEKKEVESLLLQQNPKIKDDLEQMWYLIDLVWDELGCNNKKLDWDKIGKFYAHPVWILNGLFIEQHKLSMKHRHAISDWVATKNFKRIVDYGGGFGTLARLMAQKNKNIQIDIYEPYPSELMLKRISEFKNINFVNQLGKNYDCLISIDVLEHVPDPLYDFYDMIKSVKLNGYLIIANCFYPVIKCHLPQTFHLRYSFNLFANMMGLEVIGKLDGSHATIFKKIKDVELNWLKIRFFEKVSKAAFLFLDISIPILRQIKRFLRR